MTGLKKVLAALLFASALPAAALAQEGCDPGEEEWKFSIITAVEGHPKGEAALAFARAINEKLNGRYCVTVHGDGELFNDDDIFPALLNGEAHFAAPGFPKLEQFSPKFGLFNLPFLFDGPLQADQFLASPEALAMLAEVEDDGFAGLGIWSNGMRQMSANIPLIGTDDMEGLVIRISADTPISRRFVEILGAEMVVIPFNEVFAALEAGEVDGQENTWSNIYANEFYTVQDGITETNHNYLGYPVIASKAFLDGLDPETRATVTGTMQLITHERNQFAFEINEMQRGFIIDDGGIVRSLGPEELQEWRTALTPLIDEFKTEIGAEFVDAAIAFNASVDPYE